jgi:hypothetical protein
LMARLLPQVFAVSFNPQKQAVDSIVSRRIRIVWLYPGCFCAAINSWGSNQKIYVIILFVEAVLHQCRIQQSFVPCVKLRINPPKYAEQNNHLLTHYLSSRHHPLRLP